MSVISRWREAMTFDRLTQVIKIALLVWIGLELHDIASDPFSPGRYDDYGSLLSDISDKLDDVSDQLESLRIALLMR